MSKLEIRPIRFILIGLLLLAPTAALLVSLVASDRLGIAPAAAGLAMATAVGVLVLRMIWQDSRLLADQMDRMADATDPVPAVQTASASGYVVAQAAARAHQRWLDRLSAAERRVAAGEAVVEALHDPLILLDTDRKVIRANVAARGLFGERITGRDLAVTLRNPTVLEAVDAVLAGGASRSVELMLPVPVERTLEARVKPFQRPVPAADDPEATERVALLTLHDITLLKRSEQMRADFVANASHELRTPLSTLVGFIETLRGPAKDDLEAHERFLSIMHDQANRMTRLVGDLLSLSRIELDEHTPPTGHADMGGIVRNVAAMLELKAAARKISLRIEGDAGLPPVVGDEDQLSQVVQNLMDNALKYGREQTEVTVRLCHCRPAEGAGSGRAGSETVCFAVTDRGEGIPRTHLPRLTERFYRVDPARSRALGGTGLGLAIVKHIVNRHRGRLTIDSEVGKGSTFTVHLPVAMDKEKPRNPSLLAG